MRTKAFALSALTVLLVPISIRAQVWCPPGAVWEYNFVAGSAIGCETRTYVGDTTIGGVVCQRIQIVDITLDQITHGIDTTIRFTHTYEEEGVVLEQRLTGPSAWAWDTLYWFNAPVGARWRPPTQPWQGCTGYEGLVEVLSIQEQEVSGVMLEVRILGQLNSAGEVVIDEVEMIERIGTPLMYIPTLCPVAELMGTTRIYSDDLWTGYDSGAESTCDRFNDIAQVGAHERSLILRQEGTGQLHLSWPGSTGQVVVLDQQGRTVFVGPLRSGAAWIDVAQLAGGPYTVAVHATSGKSTFAKWVKP